MTQDTYDDETLMRRVDGELTPEEGAAIDAAAARDPALAVRLEALRALRSAVREAFPARADPRDQALAALVAGSAPARAPSPFAGLGARLKDAFAPRLAPVWAGAAAACFVLGLVVGHLEAGPPAGDLVVGRDGRIADAALTRVLDTALAADAPDADGRAVGLTFQAADGAWCRTFTAAGTGVAGLACRRNDAWTLQALAPFQAAAGEIRTAAADTPPTVLAAVDALMAGDTVDAAAEARARDGGWR